jgi:hypothetical protein
MLVGCSGEPQFTLDSKAKKEFAALRGKIGLKFRNYAGQWNLVIDQGNLSQWKNLPEAPREATSAIGPYGAENLVPPEGYNYQGPYLVSPDKRFIVASLVKKIPYEHLPTTFLIVDVRTEKTVSQLHLTNEYVIDGFAWSPDSSWIAVLKSRDRFKWWRPVDFLSALAGHPIPYSEFQLDVVDLECNVIASARLVRDLPSASGDVVWFE